MSGDASEEECYSPSMCQGKKKKILLEYLAVRNYEDHMTLLFCVALCSGTQYNRHIYKKEVAGVF